MPRQPNPANLVAALKLAPVAQDQFGGSNFPGSYLWQRGGMPAEEFKSIKQSKYDEAAIPKLRAPALVRPGFAIHIPTGGIKFHAR
jgi:hypothetical protein